ncbi:MAG: peptidylprolyl isomerase [Planctomycetes bacterium]|nr:peptidylprolyl isomerase [Planctomycetota bacterium]
MKTPLLALALAPLLPLRPADPPTAQGQDTTSEQKVRTSFFEKAEPPLGPDEYCRINGIPISRSQFGDWLQKYRGEDFIQGYVTSMLVRKAAKDVGVEASPQEIERRLEAEIEARTLAAYRGKRELFIEREITATGSTMELFKMQRSWDLETEVLVTKILKRNRLTTDADVEKEFRRLYGVSGRELHLRAILIEITYPPITSFKSTEEKDALTRKGIDDAYAKALKVAKAIQSGSLDFPNAALAYSDDFESKRKGGDIGKYVVDPPEFGAEFDALIQKAKPGQVIGPVRAQAGFVLAEITRETIHDLRKERDAIRKELSDREPTSGEVQQFLRNIVFEAKLVR